MREAEVAALIDAVLTRFGQVDCVFNNAGAAAPGEIDTITLDRAANAILPVPDRLDCIARFALHLRAPAPESLLCSAYRPRTTSRFAPPAVGGLSNRRESAF
jgi:NAD(P)-dependent dehydrogenase (short-subunit alcohol dehydrogenase family)